MITEKEREYNRRYYEAHRAELRENNRRYCEAHKAKKREYNHQYRPTHRAEKNEHSRRNRALIRQEVLTHYGDGKCACVKCGYDNNIAALSIDHIKGNGAEHRREIGVIESNFCNWLKRHGFPEGYQTLCMNCQFIKKFEERGCRNAETKGSSSLISVRQMRFEAEAEQEG
jgi:hypothetical protein